MTIPFKRIFSLDIDTNDTQYSMNWPDGSRVHSLNVGQRTRTDSDVECEVRHTDRGDGFDLNNVIIGLLLDGIALSSGVGETSEDGGQAFNPMESEALRIYFEQTSFNADILDVGVAGEVVGNYGGPQQYTEASVAAPATVDTVELDIPSKCQILGVRVSTAYDAPTFPVNVYNEDPANFDNANPANKHLVVPAGTGSVIIPSIIARYAASYSMPGFPYESVSGENKIWMDFNSMVLDTSPAPSELYIRIDYAPVLFD